MDLPNRPAGTSEPPPISPVAAAIGTIVWGFVGLVSMAMLLMLPMMFDAPGSEHNPYAWVIVGSFVVLPVTCLVSVLGGWIARGITGRWGEARARAGKRIRWIVLLLPLAGVAGVVASFAALQVACHGNFRCR